MSSLKQTLWLDPNSVPPVNYLWQKKDGIYTFSNGNWKRTKAFMTVDNYCDDGEITFIARLTEGDYANIVDIPVGKVGFNPGWTQVPKDVKCSGKKAYKERDIEIWYNATYVAID